MRETELPTPFFSRETSFGNSGKRQAAIRSHTRTHTRRTVQVLVGLVAGAGTAAAWRAVAAAMMPQVQSGPMEPSLAPLRFTCELGTMFHWRVRLGELLIEC